MTRMTLVHADGRHIPFEVSSVGLWSDGEFVGLHGAARDIGERERLERDLRESEERYRFLVENSPDVVFATDETGHFTFLSAAIEAITGHSAMELIGQHFSTIVDAGSIGVATERWVALQADPARPAQAVLVLRRKDGGRVPVDVRSIGVVDGDAFAGIQGATRDISAQVRLETELRRQAGELAAGEERAHLARELHDSVTQALFSMTMVTRSVELLLDRDAGGARAQLGQLRELQREALAEMRALIFELRPGNLEQDGLVRALKTHTSALQGRLGLPIVVESDLETRLPLAAEEVLYRIAQEALHNVVKHAKAKQVWVGIHAREGGIRLRIQDDGLGFDPTRVPDGHLGLAGMRARADRIGATFVCTSQPGDGTTIEVTLAAGALAALAEAAPETAALSAPPPSIRDG
jgi:PAS domain S-box-containing protein